MKRHPIVLEWDYSGRLRSVCDCWRCQPSAKAMLACSAVFTAAALIGLVVLWWAN